MHHFRIIERAKRFGQGLLQLPMWKRAVAAGAALLLALAPVLTTVLQDTQATVPAYVPVPQAPLGTQLPVPEVSKVFMGNLNQTTAYIASTTGLSSILAYAAGTGNSNQMMFLTTDGKLYGGGASRQGEMSVAKNNNTASTSRSYDWRGNYSFFKTTQNILLKDYVTDAPQKVDFGYEFSVLLSGDGKVYTSGSGANGRLGSGNTNNKNIYTAPLNFNGAAIVDISASACVGYALTNQGKLWGWGNNQSGQIVGAASGARNAPVEMTLPTGTEKIVMMTSSKTTGVGATTASSVYVVAENSSGARTLWAAGYNSNGQLGDGTTTNRTTWVQMQISGSSTFGGNDIKQIEAGALSLIVVTNSGQAYYVGQNNNYQSGVDLSGTGNTNNITRLTPIVMPTVSPANATRLTCQKAFRSADSTFLQLSDDEIWACGLNDRGQLGYYSYNHQTGTDTARYRNTTTANYLVNPVSLQIAHPTTTNKTLTTTRYGNATTEPNNRTSPKVYQKKDANGNYAGHYPIRDLVGGVRTSLLADAEGNLRASGSYYAAHRDTSCYIWPGNDMDEYAFKVMTWPNPIRNVTRVIAGYDARMTGDCVTHPNQMMFLTEDPVSHRQVLYAGGTSDNGSLGTPSANKNVTSTTSYVVLNSPEKVDTDMIEGRIADVDMGYKYTVALSDLGQGDGGYVYTCGSNEYGKLGRGFTAGAAQSQAVLGRVRFYDATLSAAGYTDVRITQISASRNAAYAVDSQGNLWGWGNYSYGQLLGNSANRTSPVVLARAAEAQGPVKMMISSKTVNWYADYNAVYIIREAGGVRTLYAAGYNSSGQLGDNSTTNRTSFVQVNLPAGQSNANNILQMEAHSRSFMILVHESSDPVGAGQVYFTGHNVWGSAASASNNAAASDGQSFNRFVKMQMPTESTASTQRLACEKIFRDAFHTMVQLTDGMVWGAGTNDHADLGFMVYNCGSGVNPYSGTGFSSAAAMRNSGNQWDFGWLVNIVTLEMANPNGPNVQLYPTATDNGSIAAEYHKTSADIYDKTGQPGRSRVIDVQGGFNELFMADADGNLRACSDTAIWDTSTFPYMEDNSAGFRRLSARSREIQDPYIEFDNVVIAPGGQASNPDTIQLGPKQYDPLVPVTQFWEIYKYDASIGDWSASPIRTGNGAVAAGNLVLTASALALGTGSYLVKTWRNADLSNPKLQVASTLSGASSDTALVSNPVSREYRIDEPVKLHVRYVIDMAPAGTPPPSPRYVPEEGYITVVRHQEPGVTHALVNASVTMFKSTTTLPLSDTYANLLLPIDFVSTHFIVESMVPQYFQLLNYRVSDTLAGNAGAVPVTSPPKLDIAAKQEYWVTILLRPIDYGAARFGYDYKDNYFGVIQPAAGP